MTRASRTTPLKRNTYHHGDLRRAIMDEAVVMLKSVNPVALSLRELARRLGVTYGAPHYHFAEKDDLFAAIAEAAFSELVAHMQRYVESSDAPNCPQTRLRAFAQLYLDFAKADPTRYEVMFLPQLRDRTRFATLHQTGGKALQLIEEAFTATGADRSLAKLRSIGCWAALHGFAQLVNQGFLPKPGDDLSVLTQEIVNMATRQTERC